MRKSVDKLRSKTLQYTPHLENQPCMFSIDAYELYEGPSVAKILSQKEINPL